MRHIYLIRHGQASWGHANYDELSRVGVEQCERLGAYLKSLGEPLSAMGMGCLNRHTQSMSALLQGWGADQDLSMPPGDARLDEYDSAAMVKALDPSLLSVCREGVDGEYHRKRYFRVLQQALLQWMSGTLNLPSHRTYAQFLADARASLRDLQSRLGDDRSAAGLLMSSGGVISTLIADVLNAPCSTTVELNLQLRNSAICEIAETSRGWVVAAFNVVPHLPVAARARGLWTSV